MEGRKACIGCQGIVMVKNLPVKLFPLNVIPRARCVCKAKWHRFFSLLFGLVCWLGCLQYFLKWFYTFQLSDICHYTVYQAPRKINQSPLPPPSLQPPSDFFSHAKTNGIYLLPATYTEIAAHSNYVAIRHHK